MPPPSPAASPRASVTAGLALEAFVKGLSRVWKDLRLAVPLESSLCFGLFIIFIRNANESIKAHFLYTLDRWRRREKHMPHGWHKTLRPECRAECAFPHLGFLFNVQGSRTCAGGTRGSSVHERDVDLTRSPQHAQTTCLRIFPRISRPLCRLAAVGLGATELCGAGETPSARGRERGGHRAWEAGHS